MASLIHSLVKHFSYLIIVCLPLYLLRFKAGWVPFNFIEILIYLTFFLWLLKKALQKEKISFFDFPYPVFLIFFGATLAVFFSSNLSASAGIWKGWFLAPLLFYLVLIDLIKKRSYFISLLRGLFLSGALVSLVSLWYWLNGDLTYDGRLKAFFLSPNHLAMYLAPILAISLGLWPLARKKAKKTVLSVGYFCMAFVLYLTFSYGAWLGLVGAFFFLLVGLKKAAFLSDRKNLIILFFLMIIIFFLIQWPEEKLQRIVDFSYPSLKSRMVIWQSALEIAKDHPFVGIGPGVFQRYYLAYQHNFPPYPEWAVPQPHNIFLAFWLQTGLLGIVGFIWLLLAVFKKVFSFKKAPQFQGWQFYLGAVLLYFLVHGLFDTPYWKNDLAIIFWLIIALANKGDRLAC